MIEFNYTRRQSDVSLNVDGTDCNSNNVAQVKPLQKRKLVQRSITYTPKDFQHISGNSTPSKTVVLPDRFRWKIRRKSTANINITNVLENIDEEKSFNFSENWDDKKQDIEQAIKWIKQELTNLRRQDKILSKRLLDLSENLKELRGIHSCPSLNQSNSSILSGASYLSLEDSLTSKQFASSFQSDNILAFRARMVAEFQKSKPNLNVQSKALSLGNIQNTDIEPKQLMHSGSTSSCSSGVIYVTNSIYSIEDDDNGKFSFQTSLSIDHSRTSSLGDFELSYGNSDPDIVTETEKGEEKDNDTLKFKQKVHALLEDSSSDEDGQTYEDNTLTRENVADRTLTDSLDDILSAVCTKEERESFGENDVEYMV